MEEDRVINSKVVSTICTEFNDALSEAMVKSSGQLNRLASIITKDKVHTWQLISVNINRQLSLGISVVAEKNS